jgi:hypothetical protein
MSFIEDLEVEIKAHADLGLNTALVGRYMIETKVIPFAPNKELDEIEEIRADRGHASALPGIITKKEVATFK